MTNRKLKYLSLITLLIIVVIFVFIISPEKQGLEVDFFDVGQGDAILISQGDRQILIDSGSSRRNILEKLGRNMPFWDQRIEIVIATHPDQDHIGGLSSVFENYEIGRVIDSGAESKSKTFEAYENIIEEKGIEKIKAERGTVIKLSDEAILEIVSWGDAIKCGDDTNSKSVVTKLTYGENSFLFTGDLTDDCESIFSKEDVDVDVLKVAHHGSKNSSTKEFLEKVSPEDAVISSGKNNRYGHPSEETLERLLKTGAKILRTDEVGDISYFCTAPDQKCLIFSN